MVVAVAVATPCAHASCCVTGDPYPEAREEKRLRTVASVKGRSVEMNDVRTKTSCRKMKPRWVGAGSVAASNLQHVHQLTGLRVQLGDLDSVGYTTTCYLLKVLFQRTEVSWWVMFHAWVSIASLATEVRWTKEAGG